jgi:hypothetical protein
MSDDKTVEDLLYIRKLEEAVIDAALKVDRRVSSHRNAKCVLELKAAVKALRDAGG